MARHATKRQESRFDQDTAETSPVTEIEDQAISRKENVGKEDALNSFSFPPFSFPPTAVGYAPLESAIITGRYGNSGWSAVLTVGAGEVVHRIRPLALRGAKWQIFKKSSGCWTR